MENSAVKQRDKNRDEKGRFNWQNEYRWQKGQSGNPAGRPKEKTLKEYAREFLANMSEQGRVDFLSSVDPDIVWKMAEGNFKQDIDFKGDIQSKIVKLDE